MGVVSKELFKQIIRHEGLRLKPYRDTVGKLTIGIGRNLDDVGITRDEAIHLLTNDLRRTVEGLKAVLPWIDTLDQVRRDVLINMAFNMGIGGLLQFKNTLKFIQAGDYRTASVRMLLSRWSKQVGNRAKELSEQMLTGQRRQEKL